MFHPSGTPPRSPRKEGSFFGSSSDYRSAEPRSLKASSSASSLVSPSKSRRIRAAVKNLKIKTDHSTVHGSMENVQNTPYGLAQSYINESMHSPLPSPIHRKPPSVHSALNSRSSSVSSLGSNRDRSLERSRESPFGNREYSTNHIRDRSLDRQTDSRYRSHNDIDGYNTFGGRERSRERDYPFMGARSLERDHSNLHRSKSIDQEYLATHSHYLPNQPDYIHTRETLVLDLQSQIADLNKECAILQQNLDTTKEKLSSSMNSIKTFWSPELKKERMLRKEENAKTVNLSDRLKNCKQEKEKLVLQLREAENQLKLIQSQSSTDLSLSSHTHTSSSQDPATAVKKDRQAKECLILRKTIEEMELRIETQKATLTARDASIKKLLEMLQSKGLAPAGYEEERAEMDRLRERAVAEERKVVKLEKLLDQRDKEISYLSEEVSGMRAREQSPRLEEPLEKRHSADVLTLEAMVETKDGRICSLQSEIERLQREVDVYRVGSDSMASTPDRHSTVSSAQEAAWSSTEKYLKSKIDSLKTEVARRDTEVAGLQAQMESVRTQGVDKEQLISVLREQVQAKEQQCAHIQHDLDSIRERVEEKEAQLEVKSRNLLAAHTEHQRACAQLTELRDQMEVKERKAAVALKKVEHLEEVVREREEQVRSVQSRLSQLQADKSSRSSTVESLQHTIGDQTRQIEKLKEKVERRECDHQEEVDILQATIRELKNKVALCENAITDRQREISELRQASTDLGKDKTRKDAQLKEVKDELHRKTQEVKALRDDLNRKAQEVQKLEQQVKEVGSLQQSMGSLQESSIELKKEKVRRDGYIRELKDELQSKVLELQKVDEQVRQLQSGRSAEGAEKQRRLLELEQELQELKRAVQQREGEVTRTQTEVDRLLDIMRTTENEKNEKDKQIKDLHEQIKEYKGKVGNLKKNHQAEKSSQQQILEEARKNASDDTQQLKSLLLLKDERIEELEEALRESVKITAQREMLVHDLDLKVKKAEIQMRTRHMEMEDMRERCREAGEEVSQLRERLSEKGEELHVLSSERNKYILEAYDMKQEAILAAITEKDAHVAVIEMTPGLPASQTVPEVEKLTHQKHELQKKLKELTEQRMKVLMQEEKNKALVNSNNAKKMQAQEKIEEEKSDEWT